MQSVAWLLRRRLASSCRLAVAHGSQAQRAGIATASATRVPQLMADYSRGTAGAALHLSTPGPCPSPRTSRSGRTFASDSLRRCAPAAAAASQGSARCPCSRGGPQPGRGGGAAYATAAACCTSEGEPNSSDEAKGLKNDVTLLIQRLKNPPLDTSNMFLLRYFTDVSSSLRSNARLARHFSDAGGIQLLMELLQKGELDIRAESVLSAVAASPHFPASHLETLGFMDALVAELIRLRATTGDRSTKSIWPSLSPEVDRARWTWLLCGCISRLLTKHDGAGPGASRAEAAHRAVAVGLLQPLSEMLRNNVAVFEAAGAIAELAGSGDQCRGQLLDEGVLPALRGQVKQLQLQLFDADSAKAERMNACGRALAVLCTAADPALRDRIVAAGAVQPLLQLAVAGSPPAVQGPAYDALQALSRSPEARRQILDARIKQDWDLTPQAWNSWWHDLALRCSLIEHPPAPDENDNSAL